MTSPENNERCLTGAPLFRDLAESAAFDIAPCENALNLADTNRFTKLSLSPAQKIRMSALTQHIPAVVGSGVMAQAYIVKFPRGLPHTLMTLQRGGYATPIVGANKGIVGTAALYGMTSQAVALGAFTAMSVASGQYFLSQINNKLKMMTMGLDQILSFLHGDKKAELMSEMRFVQYAYENYESMMDHDQQRIATIAGLQAAKKTAIKDIEFYISELEKSVSERYENFDKLKSEVETAKKTEETLNLSQQLFTMSTIMEVYFSQNYDPKYLEAVETDITQYNTTCNDRLRETFSGLKTAINQFKPSGKMNPKKSVTSNDINSLKGELGNKIDFLRQHSESTTQRTIHFLLSASTAESKYYLTDSGDVYIER